MVYPDGRPLTERATLLRRSIEHIERYIRLLDEPTGRRGSIGEPYSPFW